MKKQLLGIERISRVLAGKLDGFYFAGGTALSKFYFNHRESYDLDFFTKDFDEKRINEVVNNLSKDLGVEVELISSQNTKGIAKQKLYYVKIDKETIVRLDFVEDVFRLIKEPKIIDGIPVLSKEDIYLRKIYAACGSYKILDELGREASKGGRQEAKDFFDLYFLSTTFMPLAKFAAKYCDKGQIESIIIWYARYDRMAIMTGVVDDIITDKKMDYRIMDKHFKQQKDALVRMGL